MILKTGKYKKSEEENKINLEYEEKRKSINAEELGIMLETRVKTELSGYIDKLRKIKGIEGEGYFSKLNTTTNREQIEEIAMKFFYSINEELGMKAESVIKGENPDVELNLDENSEKFFSNCTEMKIDARIEFSQNLLEEIKINNPDLYEKIQENNKEKIITQIQISLAGYLGDLYNLVHEITHYFTVADNMTARILDEVAPQCMERMLDNFLLELPEEELKRYNFNIKDLKKDIKTRRIISFASRYLAVEEFNKECLKKEYMSEKERETLKYFLAQLFQTQFIKNKNKQRKEKILEFMEHLKEDDFEGAVKSFGMDLRNKIKRSFYIEDIVNDAKVELEGLPQNKGREKRGISSSDKDDREF